jgi:iron(III) transport system substrate-binding protein
LYEAAMAEDGAAFYTPQSEQSSQALIDAFEAEYPGLNVELVRLATGALSQRYEEERAAGIVAGDIMMSTDPNFMIAMHEQGYFENLSENDIPNLAQWPSEYVGDTIIRNTAIFPNGILYNTELVGEDPFSDWEDLLDPAYTGELMLVDPRGIGTFQILTNMLYEEYGPEFIEALGEQVGVVVDSGIPGSQSIAAGEYSVLIYTNEAVRRGVSDQGAPVRLFVPPLVNGVRTVGGRLDRVLGAKYRAPVCQLPSLSGWTGGIRSDGCVDVG